MFVLADQNSIANHFIAEIRDKKIQLDRMRFRRNIERLGEVLAYELSKSLHYNSQEVTSPLGVTSIDHIAEYPVLIPIMRAGIPLYNGVVSYFDQAESGFIGAYRHHPNADDDFEINMDYLATPSLLDRHVILIDPMLATGRSIIKTMEALCRQGIPKHVDIISVIASKPGVAYIKENMDVPFELWVGALDNDLNDKSYIVPGLGDAGDLAFGPKL